MHKEIIFEIIYFLLFLYKNLFKHKIVISKPNTKQIKNKLIIENANKDTFTNFQWVNVKYMIFIIILIESIIIINIIMNEIDFLLQ